MSLRSRFQTFRKRYVDPKSYFDVTKLSFEDLKTGAASDDVVLVNKDGSLNITFRQLTWVNPFKLENLVLLDWSSFLWLLFASFLFCWLFFGALYYFIEYADGNLCHDGEFEGCNPLKNKTQLMECRCISGVYDFSSSLLFSLETMSSVGYGARAPQSTGLRCVMVFFLVTMQTLLDLALGCIFTVVLMFKFKQTGSSSKDIVLFSPEAVVNSRDGNLELQVMIHSRKKIYGAAVKGFIICRISTSEGDVVRHGFKSVPFGMENATDESDTFVHVMWPIILTHELTNTSPLYQYSPENKTFEHFELILILSGTTSTGATILARTSYIRREIIWGAQFVMNRIFHLRPPLTIANVDENELFKTKAVDLDKASAEKVDEKKEKEEILTVSHRFSSIA